MKTDKFNELLLTVLKSWEESQDSSVVLNDNTGELELTEENQKIFDLVCKAIDANAKKMDDLQKYKREGGTREQWLEAQFEAAYEKIELSEENREKVNDLVRRGMEQQSEVLAKEIEQETKDTTFTTSSPVESKSIDQTEASN